jgi:hypothetical protein
LEILLVSAVLAWAVWWLLNNPLADGYQNEYLHVGNAYDLWLALAEGDIWHMRWYMYTGYWPWGFHAAPWPFLSLFGMGRMQLVAGNLLHLAALIAAYRLISSQARAPLALCLLLLSPGIFGALPRFEPNLANVAWTALGVSMLVRSRRLNQPYYCIGWGVCLGVGLLMDRLTVLFFLFPAALPLLWRADRIQWRNWGLGVMVAVFLSAAYYREFFLRHTEELLGQAPVGEIDATGALTVADNGIPALYYVLSLVDSQAGPFIGAAMLAGLFIAARDWRNEGMPVHDQVLVACCLPALLFFSLVAKKQVYYTLPVLFPLSIWAAQAGKWRWLALAGGLAGWLGTGWGIGPDTIALLPEKWVAPRHVLARPPTFDEWPSDEAFSKLSSKGSMVVFSQSSALYEGFLVLLARERFPERRIRGLVLDPKGTMEFLGETESFLWAGASENGWPAAGEIQAELLSDHYDLNSLPPVDSAVHSMQNDFELRGEWQNGEESLRLYERR